MGRQGRGSKRRQQRQRQMQGQPVQRVPSSVLSAAAPAMSSADAIAEGRMVTLAQPSSRAVVSYASTAAALQRQQQRTGAELAQPGVMTAPDKQYPAMPKIAKKSPLLESMGAPGTAIFQGIITNDDYNPDFYWRDAIEIYDQMVRNDGQIMAIVQQLELPIRRATWTVEPFSDKPRDKEIASFIESCLFHDLVRTTADQRRIHQKWDDILRHALMMLRYGFAAFEKVWRKEDGWVKLAHLMPLLPMSVYRWWVGQDTELVGIQQYTFKDYTYCFVDIPADKVLLFTHRQEGQNFQGFSLLRAAYKHWYYKDQFYKIDAIGLERNAIAVPFIELPPSFNGEDVSQAQAILANLRANESMGVTLPPAWKIGYIPNSEHYQGHALKSIEHHDVMIARSVLAQFINLGSTETGTYNLAVDQRQDLLESLQAEAEYIEDVFSADVIPQLVDFNFSGVEGYPRIKCSKLAQADITELTDAISKLKARTSNFLTPDPELEDWIRDQFGMPKASKSVIAGANITAPAEPGRPNAAPGQVSDHANVESAPVAGKRAPESNNGAPDVGGAADGGDAAQASERTSGVALTDVAAKHSGVMVALMLPPDVAQQIAWPGGEPADELHITLVYLGDKADLTPRQRETLKQVTRAYAAESAPLHVRLAGVGAFPPSTSSEGLLPIYAKPEIAGIQAWRAGLVERLKAVGLPVDETFRDYRPHITLKYAAPNEPLAPPHKVNESIKGLHFTLHTMTCAIGSEQTHYVIGAEQAFAASETLSADVHALREALSVIAGMDATERGLSAAERLAQSSMAGTSVLSDDDTRRAIDALTANMKLLFNPHHDAKGLFASGPSMAPDSGGSRGGGVRAKKSASAGAAKKNSASKTSGTSDGASQSTSAAAKPRSASARVKPESKSKVKQEEILKPSEEETAIHTSKVAEALRTHDGSQAVHSIPMDSIHVGLNPREYFDSAKIQELAQSIKENGLLQPVSVRPHEGGYQVIAGERRLRAMQALGHTHVPAIVHNVNDEEAKKLAIIENINRADMKPTETGRAYEELTKSGMSVKDISESFGKSEAHVQTHLDLVRGLEPHLQALVDNERLPVGVVRGLARLSPAGREEAASRILERDLGLKSATALIKSIDARENQMSLFGDARASKAALDARSRYVDSMAKMTDMLSRLDDESMRLLAPTLDSPFRESTRVNLMIKQLQRMQRILDLAGHVSDSGPLTTVSAVETARTITLDQPARQVSRAEIAHVIDQAIQRAYMWLEWREELRRRRLQLPSASGSSGGLLRGDTMKGSETTGGDAQ